MRHLLRIRFLTVCILFFLCSVFSQAQEDVRVIRERVFTGSGLYGFMNGGAEQFLEYEVSRLTALDVVYKGEEYSIEIYEMPSPEDAFGIYSLHVFKCQRVDTLGCADCLSPYQLQAVVGDKYVSVVFPSGSVAAQQGADELLRIYAPPHEQDLVRIPDMLGLSVPYSGHVKYLRGPIGISGVSRSLSRKLADYPIKAVWFVKEKGSDSYRALIYPLDLTHMSKLYERFPASSCLRQEKDCLYIKGIEEDSDGSGGEFGF